MNGEECVLEFLVFLSWVLVETRICLHLWLTTPTVQSWSADDGRTDWLVLMGVLRRLLVSFLAAMLLLLLTPNAALAQVHQHSDETGAPMLRSLESLRDLDYDSWQAVVYRTGKPGNPVVLRLVGYPGKVRLDHPVSMAVQAGVKTWELDDITLDNPALASDGREAAAEFALDPLLADLSNNRPLRLFLPGVFNELPIPPYVVGEWRDVQTQPLS